MENNSIISTINLLHRSANQALENKDVKIYTDHFDESLEYTNADAISFNKTQLSTELEKYFRGIKTLSICYYRIKSAFEHETFTEKIARKSVLIKPKFIFLSKKQTIQTEEIIHWKNIKGEWKIVEVEVVLEEKY